MYTEQGVFIEKSDLVQGKTAKLKYSGLLYKHGAEEVYVHLGFGLLWEGLREIKMTRTEDGFEAEIPLEFADTLNFCFRDNAYNWDNNSYQNYSYEVIRMKPSVLTDINQITGSNTQLNNQVKNENRLNDPIPLNQSLVTTFNDEFGFSRLPKNYLRNKKLKIMMYKIFAYIPRILSGYNRRRIGNLLKRKIF